jgi:hypothetical protein
MNSGKRRFDLLRIRGLALLSGLAAKVLARRSRAEYGAAACISVETREEEVGKEAGLLRAWTAC